MATKRTYAVELVVEVTDSRAVLAAAAQYLVATNSEPTLAAAAKFLDGDVGNALRLLLDPGAAPCAGMSILDSAASYA